MGDVENSCEDNPEPLPASQSYNRGKQNHVYQCGERQEDDAEQWNDHPWNAISTMTWSGNPEDKQREPREDPGEKCEQTTHLAGPHPSGLIPPGTRRQPPRHHNVRDRRTRGAVSRISSTPTPFAGEDGVSAQWNGLAVRFRNLGATSTCPSVGLIVAPRQVQTPSPPPSPSGTPRSRPRPWGRNVRGRWYWSTRTARSCGAPGPSSRRRRG